MGFSEDQAYHIQREQVDDVLAAFWEWFRIQEAVGGGEYPGLGTLSREQLSG